MVIPRIPGLAPQQCSNSSETNNNPCKIQRKFRMSNDLTSTGFSSLNSSLRKKKAVSIKYQYQEMVNIVLLTTRRSDFIWSISGTYHFKLFKPNGQVFHALTIKHSYCHSLVELNGGMNQILFHKSWNMGPFFPRTVTSCSCRNSVLGVKHNWILD